MGRKGYEKVSQREYARRLNISNEAVSRAVKDRRISKGWDAKEKKIIVEIANQEFGNLHADLTNSNIQKSTNQENEKKPLVSGALNRNTPMPELKKVHQLQIIEEQDILNKRLKETLVDKEKFIKYFRDFGNEVQTKILSVPDRIIGKILIAKSRNEAHQILYNELHDILELLYLEKHYE